MHFSRVVSICCDSIFGQAQLIKSTSVGPFSYEPISCGVSMLSAISGFQYDRWNAAIFLPVLLWTVLGLYRSGWSQSAATGAVRGEILDSAGRGIPSASIEVRNLDTGVVRSTTSDDKGQFDGPGQFNIDAGVMRSLPIPWPKEGSSFQFRAEFFNALNHPQFANPNTTFGSSSFGFITSTSVNPRVGQLAIKMIF